MLTPFDDFPLHQTAVPLALAGGGHPDFYDRFWFNGYTDSFYFAIALGIYPNRGVVDAAVGIVADDVQRSVFASGRAPVDRTQTRIGPIGIEILEPLRVNGIRVDAPEHGIEAELTFTARTAAYEEPRQTRYAGVRLQADVTRATQLGTWAGKLRAGDHDLNVDRATVYGTKDRSWGVRPVGQPVPAAPQRGPDQLFFLWAPLNFDDVALHYMVFEDAEGSAWAQTAALLPVLGDGEPVWGSQLGFEQLRVEHAVQWAPGLRRSAGARLTLDRNDAGREVVDLQPLLTFRMKGAGYFHPEWAHGLWHDELVIGFEQAAVDELDTLAPHTVHVQQVMRARWGDREGLGVLEQLAIGPHQPSGFGDGLTVA